MKFGKETWVCLFSFSFFFFFFFCGVSYLNQECHWTQDLSVLKRFLVWPWASLFIPLFSGWAASYVPMGQSLVVFRCTKVFPAHTFSLGSRQIEPTILPLVFFSAESWRNLYNQAELILTRVTIIQLGSTRNAVSWLNLLIPKFPPYPIHHRILLTSPFQFLWNLAIFLNIDHQGSPTNSKPWWFEYGIIFCPLYQPLLSGFSSKIHACVYEQFEELAFTAVGVGKSETHREVQWQAGDSSSIDVTILRLQSVGKAIRVET